MAWYDFLPFVGPSEEEEIRQSDQYNEVISTIQSGVSTEQAARAVQLIQQRPNSSPGIIQAALTTDMSDEQFQFLADQDPGEDDFDWYNPLDYLAVGADVATSIGSGLYEYGLKPLVRGAFAVSEGLSQEAIQRPLSAAAAAMGGTDQEVGFREAYNQYGTSGFFQALGDRFGDVQEGETGKFDLGTGFFTGGAAYEQQEDARQLTVQGERADVGHLFANATVGQMGGDPGEGAYDWTAGLMQFGVEVLTDPANLVTGGTGIPARGAGRIVRTGQRATRTTRAGGRVGDEVVEAGAEAVTSARSRLAAAGERVTPERVREVLRGNVDMNDKATAVVVRDEMRAQDIVDSLTVDGVGTRFARRRQYDSDTSRQIGVEARAVMQAIDTGDEVDPNRVENLLGLMNGPTGRGFFARRAAQNLNTDEMLDALVDADFGQLLSSFNRSAAITLPVNRLARMSQAKTREEVAAIIGEGIGLGQINDANFYSGFTQRVKQPIAEGKFRAIFRTATGDINPEDVRGPGARFTGIAPEGIVSADDMQMAVAKADTLMRQGSVARSERVSLLEELALLPEGDNALFAGVMRRILQRTADSAHAVANDLDPADIQYDTGSLDEVFQGKMYENLFQTWDNQITQLQEFVRNEMNEVEITPLTRFVRRWNPSTASYEKIPTTSPQLASELIDIDFIIPDASNLRRMTTRSRIMQQVFANERLTAGFENTTRAMRFITRDVFKPLALLRPAYIVRTQLDDQMRMSAAGLSSIASSPTQLVQLFMSRGPTAVNDLMGTNLRARREAMRVISEQIVDIGQEATSGNRRRFFSNVTRPAGDLDEVFLNGWRQELAQLKQSEIAHFMMKHNLSPEQMLRFFRGSSVKGEELVRESVRRDLLTQINRRMTNEAMFTSQSGPGLLREMIDADDNPLAAGFNVEDIAPVVGRLLDDVSTELGMTREATNRLFDELGEGGDLADTITREMTDLIRNTPASETLSEGSIIMQMADNGVPWRDVKMADDASKINGDETARVPGADDAVRTGSRLTRGFRIPLSEVSKVSNSGRVVRAYSPGDNFDLMHRFDRATDADSVSGFYSKEFSENLPEGGENVNVIVEYHPDTKVSNMSWATEDSDVLISRNQNFTVEPGQSRYGSRSLTKNEDGEYEMVIRVRPEVEDSLAARARRSGHDYWMYDFHREWNGSREQAMELADEGMSSWSTAQRVKQEELVARARELGRNSGVDPDLLAERVARRNPEAVRGQNMAEWESLLDQMDSFRATGEVGDDLAQMVRFAPVQRFGRGNYIYVNASDVDIDLSGDFANTVAGRRASTTGNTVRAYTRPGDAPADAQLLRIKSPSQAMKIGKDEFALPASDLRFDRMRGIGYSKDGQSVSRQVMEVEVVGQPRLAGIADDVGGDGRFSEELRQIAASGDMRAEELLYNDDRLLEYLYSIQDRTRRMTNNNPDLVDLVTHRGYETEEVYNTMRESAERQFDEAEEVRRLEAEANGEEFAYNKFEYPRRDKGWDELTPGQRRRLLRTRFGDDAPQSVKSEYTPESANSMRGKWRAFVDSAAESIIAKPANELSRYPTWRQAIVNNVGELLYMAKDDALRREVFDAAVNNMNLTMQQRGALQRQLDRALGSGEGFIESVDEINQVAIANATNLIEDILFDTSTKSAFQGAFDAWVPFVDAWREGIEIWSRLVSQNPAILTGGMARLRAVESSGLLHTNERGERVFSAPMSGTMGNFIENRLDDRGNVVTDAIGAVGESVGDAFSAGNDGDSTNLEFESRLTGVNLILQSVGPGFGPIIQWPAGAFLPDTASFTGLQELINPFGDPFDEPGDIINPTAYTESLMPSWARTVISAMTQGDPDPIQWNSMMHDTLRALQMSGKYDQSSEVDRARIEEDAQRGTQWIMLLRGIVQGVSVTSADIKWQIASDGLNPEYEPGVEGWDPEADPDGVWHSIDMMAQEYRRLLEASNDIGVAMDEFISAYGVQPAYLSAKSETQSPLVGSIAEQEWVDNNSAVFTNYPAVAGYFAPPGTSDDFDYRVWLDQYAQGLRKPVSSAQKIALDEQAIARQSYYRVRDQIENSDMSGSVQRRALNQIKGVLEQEYPGWQRAVPGLSGVTTQDRILELERASNDPLLNGNPLTEPLQTYFSARNSLLGQLRAETGEPSAGLGREDADRYRQALQQIGTLLMNESDYFAGAWTILQREVN